MPIFHYKDQRLIGVKKTTFGNEDVLEKRDIQTALKKDISVLSDDILIISDEFSDWSKGQRRIDLLAVDKQANIVVIELKRTDTGDYMELQAIRYAAMISTLTWQDTIKIFSQYLQKEDPSATSNAEKELLNFLDWQEAHEDNFGLETHIMLVAADFSDELMTSVMWLNYSGLRIKCVQISPYNFHGDILIDVRQIMPLPEAADYQIRVQRKSEETKTARQAGGNDYTKYKFKEDVYNKRDLVLAVIKDWVRSNNPKDFNELEQAFPPSIRGGIFALSDRVPKHRTGRYFMEDEKHIRFDNGPSYVISNQWGGEPHKRFVEIAEDLGYEIEAVD